MSQIDFYILAENSSRNIDQIICRLCEKALTQSLNVLIYTQSTTQAQQLDHLLWSFKNNSFIAHKDLLNLSESEQNTITTSFFYPVIITNNSRSFSQQSNQPTQQSYQLLINLSAEIPPNFEQFPRIAEMIDKHSNEKNLARNRYRYYRQKGHHLNQYDV
jgi:DNA polymerase-3 subunit chi